jgi:iron complex transport system permease protein
MKASPTFWTILFAILIVIFGWAAIALGSQNGQVCFNPVWPIQMLTSTDLLQHKIFFFWRVPRVITSLLVGASLALSGLTLQGITRNPLADPYLLGISGGAGLMIVVLHTLPSLLSMAGWWLIPLAAFAGAQAAALVVLFMARSTRGRLTILGLVLSGIVINAFCAALMSFLLARFDPFRLRITTLWLAGGIGFSGWPQIILTLVATIIGWCYLRARAHELNALALGEGGALHVGIEANQLLRSTSLVSSLLAGFSVSLSGLLGYVGLIIPHAVHLLVGHDFRKTLPLATLAGALLLLIADTAARLVFAPEELPVGVLTALLGCPVLLVLLKAQLRGKSG